jgi:hypothetical protein
MIPFAGFLPDADPATPGVITDCTDMLPSLRGMKTAPSLVSQGIDALAATCLGAASMFKLDATTRTFAGTATKLYELSGTSWTDVTRATDYTTGDIRWRFAIMGNTCLATNKNDTMQYSTSGDFADIASGIKASYIDVSGGFVMAADINDGTDTPDGWMCSGFQDYADWTPSVTTQCTTGRIVDAPGPIRGLRALGSNFVIYKDRGVFFGQYVGAPAVWQWTQVPGDIGCSSHEAIISIQTAHYFIGQENFYVFDGNTIQPIGDGFKTWFFSQLNNIYRHTIRGLHDRQNSRVIWFFPKVGSSTLNAAAAYNYMTGKWGYAEYNIECPIEYVSSGITFDGLGAIAATWDDFPNVSYDSPYWVASNHLPSVINSSHALVTMTGVSAGGTLVTGVIGDDTQFSMLTRARPRFTVSPSTGTMTNSYSNTDGVTMTTDATATLNNGKFDVLRSARWHKLSYTFAGDCEVIGHTVSLEADGLE